MHVTDNASRGIFAEFESLTFSFEIEHLELKRVSKSYDLNAEVRHLPNRSLRT
jgi:hypothetical protein